MSFISDILDSARSSLKLGNVLRRFFLAFMFSFFLGVSKLITSLDQVGLNGGGFQGVWKAFVSSMYYGLGVAHATFWDFLTRFMNGNLSNQFGTIAIGLIMVALMFGFYYQPFSLLINILDFKSKKQTGDKYGKSDFHGLYTTATTIIFIIITSMIITLADVSEPLQGTEIIQPINTTIQDNVSVDVPVDTSISINTSNLINSINIMGVS